ncbi:MAG: hypothetical protein J5838_08260 [Desulfovibrio sp.]|nr:hypothetical protein [Desulfovibrio sp.]
MTFEELCRIFREHGIPDDAHLLSDSGWECDETEMDGIWFNRERNEVVFTQGGWTERECSKYAKRPGWVLIACEPEPTPEEIQAKRARAKLVRARLLRKHK